jgi:hypothetical protein
MTVHRMMVCCDAPKSIDNIAIRRELSGGFIAHISLWMVSAMDKPLNQKSKLFFLAASVAALLIGNASLGMAAEAVDQEGLFQRDQRGMAEERVEMTEDRAEERSEMHEERAEERSGIAEERAERQSEGAEQRAEALDEAEGQQGLFSSGASGEAATNNDVDERSNRFNGPDVEQRTNRFNSDVDGLRGVR